MGILPLQFLPGENAESLGLTGAERFDVEGVAACVKAGAPRGSHVTIRVDGPKPRVFRAGVRLDTPQEVRYFEHGGILPYVLRKLLGAGAA
jgi:aconitate hydratase